MSASSPSAEPVSGPSARQPSPTAASKAAASRLPLPPSPKASAMTVLPPMTTHWITPRSCTWTYVADSHFQPVPSEGAVAWLDLKPRPGASTLSCYPDGMFSGERTGVFSPATCPSGWTTVSLHVDTETDVSGSVTTTAVCCSSLYTLDDSGSHCKRSVPTVLAVPITYDEAAASTYEVMPSLTTTWYGATVAVSPIRALFREQDMSILGLTDEEEIREDELHDESFPLAMRIGVAVGVTVMALLVIGAVVFCLLYWRRSRKKRAKGLGSHDRPA